MFLKLKESISEIPKSLMFEKITYFRELQTLCLNSFHNTVLKRYFISLSDITGSYERNKNHKSNLSKGFCFCFSKILF